MSVKILSNFIDGKFIPSSQFIESFNPGTGEVFAHVPDSGKVEVDLAVEAARRALPSWSNTPPAERANLMRRVADIVESRKEEFAQTEAFDQGKPFSLARSVDIPRVSLNFRKFASYIEGDMNKSSELDEQGVVNYTTQTPVGVCGLISPWNLPLYLLTFKIAPCIAAGCTCVCKPSEMTSVTAWMLGSVLNEAGIPPGVVNIIFGYGYRAGQAIIEHPDIPAISFTGGTVTGKKVMQACAENVKKSSLELGGKNPCIVFDDADLDQAVPGILKSSFGNQGEVCLATSRIYVQDRVYDKFVSKFVEGARQRKVGPQEDSETQVGALISKEHLGKVRGYVALAVQEGGTVLCGELSSDPELVLPAANVNGYFMRPTVITGLADSTRVMQEEIFGPVTCISRFISEEEVIPRANGVQYGLSACIWTTNLGRCHRVAKKLEVGMVWVNCWLVRDLRMPFGGFKESGIGRDSLSETLDFYREEKTVCIKF